MSDDECQIFPRYISLFFFFFVLIIERDMLVRAMKNYPVKCVMRAGYGASDYSLRYDDGDVHAGIGHFSAGQYYRL